MKRCGIVLVLSIALGTACLASRLWAAEGTPVKYVRFKAGRTTAYGVLEGDQVRQIEGNLFGPRKPTDKKYRLAEVELLVPVQATKVLALAGNYKSHLGQQVAPKNPEVFLKVPSCLVAHGQKIVLPAGAGRVDHEGELVIVIGKRARSVPPEKALDYVLGVTCGNDVSARDWQQNDGQWWRAKGSDTFGPCGPCIAAGLNYDDLMVTCRINGEVKQQQRTKDLIFGVGPLVSFISRHMTLEPGDLIYTGTPGTTTALKSGDVVEVQIEGVGVLRNPVAAATEKAEKHTPGLIGLAHVNGKPTRIAYHYPHGKVFPADLIRSRFHDGQTELPSVEISLVGYVEVPQETAVDVYHAAGGVNRDHGTLFLDGRRIGQVGDDTAKSVVYKLTLPPGKHEVRWVLTGGTFQTNLLKFQAAKTGDLLNVYHTAKQRDETGAAKAAKIIDAQGTVEGWPTVDPKAWIRVSMDGE